jgi:DNA-binding response OmpR family regulator
MLEEKHPPPENDPRAVAVVLSVNGSSAPEFLSALSALAITAIARPYDDSVGLLLDAIAADMVVVVCKPDRISEQDIISEVARQSASPLLVVDLTGTAEASIQALKCGADAVVNAAADEPLMTATVTALLRRRQKGSADRPLPPPARVGSLTVDNDTFEIRDGGLLIPLTPMEYKITEHLATHLDGPVSASQIMALVHDYPFTDNEARAAVRVYIRRIRHKFILGGSLTVEIVNVRKAGYRMRAVEEKVEALVA